MFGGTAAEYLIPSIFLYKGGKKTEEAGGSPSFHSAKYLLRGLGGPAREGSRDVPQNRKCPPRGIVKGPSKARAVLTLREGFYEGLGHSPVYNFPRGD